MSGASDIQQIVAVFHPQAWYRDTAIDVDAAGPVTFDVTEAILAMGRENALALEDNSDESDELRSLSTAPSWVQEWRGPFYITVKDSIAAHFAAYDVIGPRPPQHAIERLGAVEVAPGIFAISCGARERPTWRFVRNENFQPEPGYFYCDTDQCDGDNEAHRTHHVTNVRVNAAWWTPEKPVAVYLGNDPPAGSFAPVFTGTLEAAMKYEPPLPHVPHLFTVAYESGNEVEIEGLTLSAPTVGGLA
jgi:hypothetical protein